MQDSSHTVTTPSQAPSVNDTVGYGEPVFQFVDSVSAAPLKSNAKAPPQTYINFYSGHELPVKHNSAIPFRDATPDWLFYTILLVMAALAWIRYYYGKIFGQTLQAIFNVNITNQIVRDENVLLQRTSAFLGVIFNVVLAIILYHLSVKRQWYIFGIDNTFGKFLFFLLAVSAVYSFKFLVLKMTGFIFNVEREMATYIFNIFLINNMLGLLLIPLAVLLSFLVAPGLHSILLLLACILYILSLTYRILRGSLIGFSYNGVNLMYLFLYFCALEFAPFMVLLKFLIR